MYADMACARGHSGVAVVVLAEALLLLLLLLLPLLLPLLLLLLLLLLVLLSMASASAAAAVALQSTSRREAAWGRNAWRLGIRVPGWRWSVAIQGVPGVRIHPLKE